MGVTPLFAPHPLARSQKQAHSVPVSSQRHETMCRKPTETRLTRLRIKRAHHNPQLSNCLKE